MNIGNKKEQTEGTGSFNKIGLETFKVVKINPDASWVKDFLGLEEEPKESEYIGEDKDGNTRVKIDFWLEGENSGFKTKATFFIADKEVYSEKSGKYQFISCTGDTSWVDDEKNLQDWFKKFMKGKKPDRVAIGDKTYRKAKVGEQDLYEFIKNWLSSAPSPVDFNNITTDILLDFKKLMRGNVSELTSLVGTEDIGPIGAMVEVRTVDTDNGTKNYSQIYSRAFFPGYKMKLVRNILTQTAPDWSKDYTLNNFWKSISDPEFGSKNTYLFSLIQDYNENMSIVSTNKIITIDGSDY